MRVYIAGPITSRKDLNRKAFDGAAVALKRLGHEPVNPLELHDDLSAGWHELMKTDIKTLVDCDAVFLLKGWKRSVGARLERRIALALGLQILS